MRLRLFQPGPSSSSLAITIEKMVTMRISRSTILLDICYEIDVESESIVRAFIDRDGFCKEVAQVIMEAGKPKLSGKFTDT